MTRYIIRRILQAIPILLFISVVVYGLIVLSPVDPLAIYEHNPTYTQALLSAVPVPNPKVERQRERIILEGDVPSPTNPPPGCNFNPRCPLTEKVCRQKEPEWREAAPRHWVACHLV